MNVTRSSVRQVLFLAGLLAAGAGLASGSNAADEDQGAIAERRPDGKVFLVQFSVGPGWVAGRPPQEQSRFKEHGSNLRRLRDEGRIVLGARYADKGLIVVRFASEEQARAEMASDPGVQAGTFVFEVHQLQPFYDGCLERAVDRGPAHE